MEIDLILWLQASWAWLIPAMKAVTALGYLPAYILMLTVIYWCLSPRLGLRLGLMLTLTGVLNDLIKLLAHAPRPVWVEPGVRAYGAEKSFGMPSGHAQSAAVMWGYLAVWFRRRWVWAAAGALAFLVGFSRIVLGVHFPGQVVAGWLLGALTVWAFVRLEGPVATRLQAMTPARQAVLAFIVSLSLIAAGASIVAALAAWQPPAEWAVNAAAASPRPVRIDPLRLKNVVGNSGIFFGVALGAVFLAARGGFDVRGSLMKRLGRLAVGLIGAAVIIGAMELSARPSAVGYLTAHLIRYLGSVLCGAWVAGLAPLLFVRLGLASGGR